MLNDQWTRSFFKVCLPKVMHVYCMYVLVLNVKDISNIYLAYSATLFWTVVVRISKLPHPSGTVNMAINWIQRVIS